ncbi:MAG: hypothetical protein KKB35_02290, partial [Proteobacteria bacterium]|nr:hypothetical protein [Pseudomonadota bacterium]
AGPSTMVPATPEEWATHSTGQAGQARRGLFLGVLGGIRLVIKVTYVILSHICVRLRLSATNFITL